MKYLENFVIQPQEVVLNYTVLKDKVMSFYRLLRYVVSSDLVKYPFRFYKDVYVDNNSDYVECRFDRPIDVYYRIIRSNNPKDIPFIIIENDNMPGNRFVNLSDKKFYISVKNSYTSITEIVPLFDPLIINILIDQNIFHHFILAMKSVRDESLRKTLIGITKYCLLENPLIIDLMKEKMVSTSLSPGEFETYKDIVKPTSVDYRFVVVKLKGKDKYYTIEVRELFCYNKASTSFNDNVNEFQTNYFINFNFYNNINLV